MDKTAALNKESSNPNVNKSARVENTTLGGPVLEDNHVDHSARGKGGPRIQGLG